MWCLFATLTLGFICCDRKLQVEQANMEVSRSRVREVIDTFEPRMFQRYTLDAIVFAGDKVSIFQGHENESRERFIFYISERASNQVCRDVEEFETCARVKIFRTPDHDVIQETFYETTLNEYLNSFPPERAKIDEAKIAEILLDVFRNLVEFKEKGFVFGNISLNSVVYEKGRWKLDIASGILGLYSSSKVFYPYKQKGERTQIYALGVILFTCLFGFYPFANTLPDLFRIKTYLECLNQKSLEDCSKIILFLKTKLTMSKDAIDVLERSLSISRSISLEELMNHPFFTVSRVEPTRNTDNDANYEIKMISELEPRDISKVLVAFEKFKASPAALRRENPLFVTNYLTVDGVKLFLERNPYFQHFNKSQEFRLVEPVQHEQQGSEHLKKPKPVLKVRYFGREINDLEDEYPCRELIKYLGESRHAHGYDLERQTMLLRYAYPYSIALELLKVQHKQTPEIQKRIDLAVSLLLTVSNLCYEQSRPAIPELHPRQMVTQPFESLKPRFRQVLHSLYKYFMDMAIYKYNTAKKELLNNPSFEEAAVLKEEGLNVYRLCWKILEASLIVRKQGRELDLGHLETSERKEIEMGLNNLLGRYFPNKIY